MSLLQFAENLSDRRETEAVRGRINWKYLLGLELTDPGFDASMLSEFRGHLVAGGAEAHLLDNLPALCRELKLLSARSRQLPEPSRMCDRDAAGRPECLGGGSTRVAACSGCPAWLEQYGRRADDYDVPQGEAKRRAHAAQIGCDGHHLLAAIKAPGALPASRRLLLDHLAQITRLRCPICPARFTFRSLMKVPE